MDLLSMVSFTIPSGCQPRRRLNEMIMNTIVYSLKKGPKKEKQKLTGRANSTAIFDILI